MKTPMYISNTMYIVLDFLARRAPNGTARVSEISRGAHLSPSVVSSSLKKLTELGLVTNEGWGAYQVTLRGKIISDIFSKKDWPDEKLLEYWFKAIIQPKLAEMMSIAQEQEKA